MKKRVIVLWLALLMMWPAYPGSVPAANASDAVETPTETPAVTTDMPDIPAETPEAVTETATDTPEAPMDTPEVPTDTPEVPTDTPEVPTDTPEIPTDTPEAATDTPEAATDTPESPMETPEAATETPEAPTETPVPEENHRHQASCAAPNICVQCGEPCAVAEKDLLHSGEKAFAANTVYHWYVWTCCGGTAYDENGDVPLEIHRYSCTAPDACAVCGFAGYLAGGDPVEHDWSDWQSDENSHWRVCLRCGEKTETTPHSAACDRPSVCVECGASGKMAYTIDHIYDMTQWQSDENAHWRECTRCGEKTNLFLHWAACDQTSVCAECGAAGHMSYLAGHTYDENIWFSDETAHWHECTRCGQKTSPALHWAACANPDICAVCGAAGTMAYLQEHTYESLVCQSDERNHWYVCSRCGEQVLEKRAHYASCDQPEICVECGATGIMNSVSHYNQTVIIRLDGDYHLVRNVCTRCGAEEDYKIWHHVRCDNPTVCVDCGETGIFSNGISHEYQYEYVAELSDASQHCRREVCTRCGKINEYRSSHYAHCDAPTTCTECGMTDILASHVSHDYNYSSEDWQANEIYHWRVCARCGEVIQKDKHTAHCDHPDTCAACGTKGVMSWIYHDYSNHSGWQTDETYHWYNCNRCGEMAKGKHWRYCASVICSECGTAGRMDYIEHEKNVFSDENYHWLICQLCGEEDEKEAHWAYCDAPSVCATCGSGNIAGIRHDHDEDALRWDETGHWWYCARCGKTEADREGHQFDAEGTCTVCGYVRIPAEPTETPFVSTEVPVKPTETPAAPTEMPVEPTATPAPITTPPHEHQWTESKRMPADCTQEGMIVYECLGCGEIRNERISPLGHAFGQAVSDGKGNHAEVCVRCGREETRSCVPEETRVNSLKAYRCPVCGYTVSAAARLELSPATEISGASAAPPSDAEGAPGIAFTAYDVTGMLPQDFGAGSGFLIVFADLDADAALPYAVKIMLPWPRDTAGLKLVLVRENGETSEIAYEMTDGTLRFETEEGGLFVFIPA